MYVHYRCRSDSQQLSSPFHNGVVADWIINSGSNIIALFLELSQRPLYVATLDVDVFIRGIECIVSSERNKTCVISSRCAATELVNIWIADDACVVHPNLSPSRSPRTSGGAITESTVRQIKKCSNRLSRRVAIGIDVVVILHNF